MLMMLALALLSWVWVFFFFLTFIVDKDCVLQKEKINLLISNNHMAILKGNSIFSFLVKGRKTK